MVKTFNRLIKHELGLVLHVAKRQIPQLGCNVLQSSQEPLDRKPHIIYCKLLWFAASTDEAYKKACTSSALVAKQC